MAAPESNSFAAADYVVFTFTIVVSVAIGIFFAFRARKSASMENYFLGNRKLPYIPVALSFLVTFESSILILGFPAEVYVHGMTLIWVNLGLSLSLLLASRITVDIFHPLKITSVFEYFKLRYQDNFVRYFTVVTGIVYYVFYMGIVLYGPALAIKSVTGFPVWATVCCFALASILYTSVGGIKAVIWTDVFQFVIMTTGMVAMAVKGTIDAGGFDSIVSVGMESGRLDIWEFNPDPRIRHTFWTLTIGSITQYMYITLNQSSVQRLNSTPRKSDAKKVLYIVIPLFAITQILAMVQGLIAFGYYSNKGCDPLVSGAVENVNQIIPYSMMDLFRGFPGLPGLFIASLSSASLSTVSSGLSSLSAVTCQDFVRPRYPNISDGTMTAVAKAAVILFGIVSTGLAFLMSYIDGPLQQIFISFMGSISGPTTGVFLLSIFFRRATSKGALTGGVVGTAFLLWVSFGYNFSKTLPSTPWLPLGPTDTCIQANLSSSLIVDSNFTRLSTDTLQPLSSTEINVMGQGQGQSNEAEGLDKLYSISYMYFSLMGTLTSLVVGILASLLTKQHTNAGERYVLSLTNQFCCCLAWGKGRTNQRKADCPKADSTDEEENKECEQERFL